MTSDYSFHRLGESDVPWADIECSADGNIYFTAAWASYLRRMGRSTFVVEVMRQGKTIGWFIGHRRWLGIGIISAPAMATGTYCQGLCLKCAIPVAQRIEIYQTLVEWLFNQHIASYVQVCDWQLRVENADWAEPWHHPLLDKAGIRYNPRWTYTLDLTSTEEELWQRLSKESVRRKVGRAMRNGLKARVVDDGDVEAFVDRHLDHLKDVQRRHGNRGMTGQRRENLLALCKALYPDKVLMVEVVATNPDGSERSVASAIRGVSDGLACGFSNGSYASEMHLFPNELLLWEAMLELHKRGCRQLVLGGMADYKRKYGSHLDCVPVLLFSRWGFLFGWRKRLKAWYQRLLSATYRIMHPKRQKT